MDVKVWDEIDGLRRLTTGALRTKYPELFQTETSSSNKPFLIRRIAWRLQVRAEGDLSERARRRAAEIADDADLRLRGPESFVSRLSLDTTRVVSPRLRRDWRLPPPGTVLSRLYQGQAVVVQVSNQGFEYQGRQYRSLSAIAREVTGTRWNGLAFFQLTERRHA